MKEFSKTVNLGKVLIFGGSGWLGKRLVNVVEGIENDTGLLTKKTSISVVVKDMGEKSIFKNNEVKIIVADIKNAQQLYDVFDLNHFDTVFILAGIIHPARVSDFYKINFHGVCEVASKAIEKHIKNIIIMSSNSPFGFNKSELEPFNHNSSYSPYQNYGKSKMLMEQKIRSFSTKKSCISIIRSPWFYGPGQPARQKKFFSMIKKGIFPIYQQGKYLRSMAYLDNIIQGLLLAADQKKLGLNHYWIADKKPYEFIEIIETIQNVLEKEFGVSVVKKSIVMPSFFKPVAQFADTFIQKSGFYSEKVHVLSELGEHIFCDISKSENDLGYRPKIGLYQGMLKSISDLKKDGFYF